MAASVSLFGFYLLIKYVPDFSPAAFLNAYFWALGSFAIGGAAVPLLRKVTDRTARNGSSGRAGVSWAAG